jgi:uncharacterized Tic20 family protein
MSVFLISFFGSILAAFLVSWIRRNKKPDPTPANSNEIVEFPRSRTIIFASVCVLIAWVCMLVFLISVFLPTLGIESNLFNFSSCNGYSLPVNFFSIKMQSLSKTGVFSNF